MVRTNWRIPGMRFPLAVARSGIPDARIVAARSGVRNADVAADPMLPTGADTGRRSP
jgi:hypothetical protein